MEEININEEFSKFGKKALIIAILLLASIVVIILLAVLPLFIQLPDLDYINWIIQLIILVAIIIAATHIFHAGKALKNQDLLSFRRLIVAGLIFVLIGSYLASSLLNYISGFSGSPNFLWASIILFGVPVLLLLIIGTVFEIIAWGNLKKFFDARMSLFSGDIGKRSKTGSFLNQLGSIFYLTIILAFVGFIIKVIGYIFLYNLRNLDLESSEGIWRGEREKAIEPSKEEIQLLKGKKLLYLGIIILAYALIVIVGSILTSPPQSRFAGVPLGIIISIIGIIPTIIGIKIIKGAKNQ